jgi:hypothetical protein
MVAILSRWSEQSGASPCTSGEYSDAPATHPLCGESSWMARRRHLEALQRRDLPPECRGDPSSRAGGPDTSAPYDPGLLVVLPGSRHSSLCQWPSRIGRWRPAGTQPWATRSVAINFSGPGRALGFALRDLRCRRAQLAAADRADRRWPRGGRGRFMGHRSGLARNGTSGAPLGPARSARSGTPQLRRFVHASVDLRYLVDRSTNGISADRCAFGGLASCAFWADILSSAKAG